MSFRVKLNSNFLIQGIGNPIRQDDGVGFVFIERIKDKWTEADLDWVYQLQIENAEQWSKYDQVILVDAHLNQEEPFKWTELSPQNLNISDYSQLTSHAITPEAVLFLCRKHFNKTPQVLLLSIKGVNFGLGEGVSQVVDQALILAIKSLEELFDK
jgi:hydrogenase maturation protease